MQINESTPIKLYFFTQGVLSFAITSRESGYTFKLSVREKETWNTTAMLDVTGTVENNIVNFAYDTNTEEFARVCQKSGDAFLCIYSDTNGQREVFLQRRILIAPNAGTIDGQPQSPALDPYLKTVDTMPTASASIAGRCYLFAGQNTASYTRGHYYRCEIVGSVYTFVDITASGTERQADWSQTDTTAPDFIKNKPTIPAAQVQANWNETDTTSKAYIQNKPDIPSALSDLTEDFTHQTVTSAQKTSWNGKAEFPSGQTANKYLGTNEQNELAWKTVPEPQYPVTSVNNKTGAVNITASDVNALPSGGQTASTVTASSGIVTLTPDDYHVYLYNAVQGDTITIPTSGYSASKVVTFEFWITQGATAVSITFQNNVKWGDGNDFKSSSTPPSIGTANTLYCFVFRLTTSGTLLGNIAYTEELS